MIISLPPEILVLILKEFCRHCLSYAASPNTHLRAHPNQQRRDDFAGDPVQTHALYALCLVSKRMRTYAEPILYHEFIPGYGDPSRSGRYSWDRRLTSFMRTVAERPKLATQVRTVHIRFELFKTITNLEARRALEHAAQVAGIGHRAPAGCGDDGSGGADLLSLLGKDASWEPRQDVFEPPKPVPRFVPGPPHCPIIDMAALEGCTSWRVESDIKQASDACKWQERKGAELVRVLVFMLPTLERLSLQTTSHFEFRPIPVSPDLSNNEARVEKLPLKALDLALHGRSDSTPLHGFLSLNRQMANILQFTTGLQTLNIHLCGRICSEDAPSVAPLPNLKHLWITQSGLHSKELASLLSACGKLETFYYEAAYRHNWHYDYEHFQTTQALQYLGRSQGKTLKALHLDLRGRDSHRNVIPDQPLWQSILDDFDVLAHLSVNPRVLCSGSSGADSEHLDFTPFSSILPASLESLSLVGEVPSGTLPQLARSLLHFAKATGAGLFPRFKRLRLDAAAVELADYGITGAFAGLNIEVSHETWLPSDSALRDSDWMPQLFMAHMELPDEWEDPDL